MSTDSQRPELVPQNPNWWNLPKVISLSIRSTYFRTSKYQFLRSAYSDEQEGIELLATYEGEFQTTRALSPILYVGDIPVGECELLDGKKARFFSFEPEKLKQGASVFIGWPGDLINREDTGFRYEL